MEEPAQEPEVPDYYQILSIAPEATIAEIKQSFRRLAKLHHPDKQAPGSCADAEDFRKVREAQECLCDEVRRHKYDRRYPRLQEAWAWYRKMRAQEQILEELRLAEEERERQWLAEEAARQRAVVEEAQRKAEELRAARQREVDERLRRVKEAEAEKRSEEAGRRARERHEKEAIERLRRDKEIIAEARSKRAAQKARDRQEEEAKIRLADSLRKEKLDSFRKKWAAMRDEAELRSPKRATNTAKKVTVSSDMQDQCTHQHLAYGRKKGFAKCYFCRKACSTYWFCCRECEFTTCGDCKMQHCGGPDISYVIS